MLWRASEEAYLQQINRSAQNLSDVYNAKFEKLRDLSTKFRLPAIVIGATASAVSFGTSTFPMQIQGYISVIVGTTSLLIAIINTIESYLEISKTMTAALMTSTNMKKLSDDILCELALEEADRETSGIFFLRTVYTRYQQIITSAPPLEASKNAASEGSQPMSLTQPQKPHPEEAVVTIPKEELKEQTNEDSALHARSLVVYTA